MQTEPDAQNFKELCQQYSFAPLIEIALEFAVWIKQHIAKKPWKLRDRRAN